MSKYYTDTINWAFTSKQIDDKITDEINKHRSPVSITQDNAIIYATDDEILIDAPLTLMNLVLFLDGMKRQYNDGSEKRDIVTFIGADFVDGMQIKCNIKLSNDSSTILVDPETLNFLENQNIASIPQTSEDYCQEIRRWIRRTLSIC